MTLIKVANILKIKLSMTGYLLIQLLDEVSYDQSEDLLASRLRAKKYFQI